MTSHNVARREFLHNVNRDYFKFNIAEDVLHPCISAILEPGSAKDQGWLERVRRKAASHVNTVLRRILDECPERESAEQFAECVVAELTLRVQHIRNKTLVVPAILNETIKHVQMDYLVSETLAQVTQTTRHHLHAFRNPAPAEPGELCDRSPSASPASSRSPSPSPSRSPTRSPTRSPSPVTQLPQRPQKQHRAVPVRRGGRGRGRARGRGRGRRHPYAVVPTQAELYNWGNHIQSPSEPWTSYHPARKHWQNPMYEHRY